MKVWGVRSILALLVMSGVVYGQSMDRNPVDVLKEQAAQALSAANVPLTPDQEKQLAIAIEDEHQAAENLSTDLYGRCVHNLNPDGIRSWTRPHQLLD